VLLLIREILRVPESIDCSGVAVLARFMVSSIKVVPKLGMLPTCASPNSKAMYVPLFCRRYSEGLYNEYNVFCGNTYVQFTACGKRC
jgi:hypothetical protein